MDFGDRVLERAVVANYKQCSDLCMVKIHLVLILNRLMRKRLCEVWTVEMRGRQKACELKTFGTTAGTARPNFRSGNLRCKSYTLIISLVFRV